MGSPRVLLLVISVILAGAGMVSCSCSQEKYTAMQASFSNCSSQLTQQSGEICQLLESVVDQCSKLWLACHSKKEVAKMRDLHINHLIKSYQETEDLEDCRVVKEYRLELDFSNILLPWEIICFSFTRPGISFLTFIV